MRTIFFQAHSSCVSSEVNAFLLFHSSSSRPLYPDLPSPSSLHTHCAVWVPSRFTACCCGRSRRHSASLCIRLYLLFCMYACVCVKQSQMAQLCMQLQSVCPSMCINIHSLCVQCMWKVCLFFNGSDCSNQSILMCISCWNAVLKNDMVMWV